MKNLTDAMIHGTGNLDGLAEMEKVHIIGGVDNPAREGLVSLCRWPVFCGCGGQIKCPGHSHLRQPIIIPAISRTLWGWMAVFEYQCAIIIPA